MSEGDGTHHDEDEDDPKPETGESTTADVTDQTVNDEDSDDSEEGWVEGDPESDPYAGMIIEGVAGQQSEPEPASEPEPEQMAGPEHTAAPAPAAKVTTEECSESEEASPPADEEAVEVAAAAAPELTLVLFPEPTAASLPAPVPVQPATEERPDESPDPSAEQTSCADDAAPSPPMSPATHTELVEMTSTYAPTQVEAISTTQLDPADRDSPAIAETAGPAMDSVIPTPEPEPEPEPEVPTPVPAPDHSPPAIADLESFFGSLSLPVGRIAALADKLGIGGASDFKEFSEHELVEEHGFEAEHIRKIFGALSGEEEASMDSMTASSDPPKPAVAPSPPSKAQREADALPFDHPGPKSKLSESSLSERERKKLARVEMQNPAATLKSKVLEQSKLTLHRPGKFIVLDDFEARSPDWMQRGGDQLASDERWHYFLICPNEPYFSEAHKIAMSWWEHADDCAPYCEAIDTYEKPKLPFPDILSPEPTKIVCTKRMDGDVYYRIHRSKQFRDTWEDVTFPTKYPDLLHEFQQRMADEAAGVLNEPTTPASKPKLAVASVASVAPPITLEMETTLTIPPPTSRKIVKKAQKPDKVLPLASNKASKKIATGKKHKKAAAAPSTADDFLNSATTPSLKEKLPNWWIGKRVRVKFAEGFYFGTVNKWVPNRQGGAGNPFWIVYDDGDELYEKIPSPMVDLDNRGGHKLPRKLVDKDSEADSSSSSDDEALSTISAKLPPATTKHKPRTFAPRAQIPKPQAAIPRPQKPKAQPTKLPKAQPSAKRYSTGGAVIRGKGNGKAAALVLESSSSSDDDAPLNLTARRGPTAKLSAASTLAGGSKSSKFASDEDEPLIKKRSLSKSRLPAKRPRESAMVIDSNSDDEGGIGKSSSRNSKARKVVSAFSSDDDNLSPDDFENNSFDEDNASSGESGLAQSHKVLAINATRPPYQSSKRRNQVKSPSPNKGGGPQKIESFEITLIHRTTNESKTFVTAQDAALALNLDQKSVRNLQTLAKKSKATKSVVVNSNWKAVRASLAVAKLPKSMASMVRKADRQKLKFKIYRLAAGDDIAGLIAAQWQSWFSTPGKAATYHIDDIHAVQNAGFADFCQQKKNQWFPSGEMPFELSYYQFLSFSHSDADQALLGSILENGLFAGDDNRTAAGLNNRDKSHPSVWKDFSQGGVLTYKHLDTSIKTASSYGNSTGFFLIIKCTSSPADKWKRFPTTDSLSNYDLGSGAKERIEIKPSAFKKNEDGTILYTSYQRDEDCTCHLDFDASNKKFPYRQRVRQCVPLAVVSYFHGDNTGNNTLMQRQRIEASCNLLKNVAGNQSSQRGSARMAATASRSLRPQPTAKFANLRDNRRGHQRDTPASAYGAVQMSPASDDDGIEIVPSTSPTPSLEYFGGGPDFDQLMRSEPPQPSVSILRPKIKNLKDRPDKNPMGNHLKYSQAAVPPPPPLGPSDEPALDASFDSPMEIEFEVAPPAPPPIPDIGLKTARRSSAGPASGRSTPKGGVRAQRCTLMPKQIPVQFRRNGKFTFHTMTLRALAPSKEVRIPIIDERRGARAEFHAWKDEKTIREKAFKDMRTGALARRSAMVEVSFDPDESMPAQEEIERVKTLKSLERDLLAKSGEFGSMCILQGHSLDKTQQLRLYLLPAKSRIIAEMYSLYSDDTQRNRDSESWMGLLWWGNDVKDMSLGTYVDSMRPNKRKPPAAGRGGGNGRDPRKRQPLPKWNGLELRYHEAVADIESTVIMAGQTLERQVGLADLEEYLSEKNARIEATTATHEVAMLDMLKPASAMSMLRPMQLVKINAESAIKNRIMSLQHPNGQALLQDEVTSATHLQQWVMPELPESGTGWDTPRLPESNTGRR